MYCSFKMVPRNVMTHRIPTPGIYAKKFVANYASLLILYTLWLYTHPRIMLDVPYTDVFQDYNDVLKNFKPYNTVHKA